MKNLDSIAEIENRLRLRDLRKGKVTDEDLRLVYKFAEELTKDFGGFVHGVILFGSVARGKEGKDLDILVIVDDVKTPITKEVIGAYRLGVGRILAKLNAVDRIHVTTIGIADFWDGVRLSDPIIVNVLRDGKAIVDTGFFEPLKRLLELGRIRPSKEAIEAHINKAKLLLNSVNVFMRTCIDNLYWATMDAAHAALMSHGITPPTPGDVPKVFKRKMKGKVKERDIELVDKMYKRMKELSRKRDVEINPSEVKKLKKEVERFVKRMERLCL